MVLLPIYHAKWLNAFPLLRGVQIFPKRSNGWRMLLANHVEKHASYKWFLLLFFLPFSPTPEVMIEYYANDRKWPQPTTPFFCSCFCGSGRLNLAAQAVLKFAIGIFGRILTFAYCTGSDHRKRMAKYDSSLNPATIIYVALLLYSQPLEKQGS